VGNGMKRFASFGLVVLVAVLACVGPVPASQADSDHRFKLTVDRHALRSGQRLTVTASAPTRCVWLLEWHGDRRHVEGSVFTTTYIAPQVSRPTRIPLHGTCFYNEPAGARTAPTSAAAASNRSALTITVTVPPSWRQTVVVTVVPPGGTVSPPHQGAGSPGTGGGGLPNTGGPMFWLLIAGLASLIAGGTAASRSRPEPASTC